MSNTGSASLGKMTSSGRVTSKVGQLLQEARRQRGLEIKDIAASTHVRSEYLSALEEGRFSELPENVYTRNFLRLYAEAVGLDEQEVLEHYSLERYGKSDAPRKSVYPSPAYDTTTESYVAGTTEKVEDRVRRRRGVGWLVPLLALALIGLGGFYTWRNFVFPNDATGGYTLTIPGLDREINLPNFNRTATTDPGTEGVANTDGGTTTTNPTDTEAGSTSSSELTVPDANSTEGTEVSTGTTSDATAAEGLDAAGTETQGTESQGGTDANGGSATEGDGTTDGATLGADSGENASEGQLITPTLGDGTAATVEGDTTTEGIASGTEGNDATDAAGGLILFSIVTEPSGAEVTVDGFDLGTTPVSSFPLTPSAEKQLSISLDGYETVEQSFDGTEAQDLFVTLTEASGGTGDVNDVEGDATTVDSITIASDGTVIATDDPSFTPAAELQGKAVITIEDGGEAWLEVYEGTTRSGDPLVYRVANDSDRFEFDMPVVVRAGRSSLVQVSVNGGLAKPLGPPDEVAQQTFDE